MTARRTAASALRRVPSDGRAFSVTELAVVIGVIGLLVTVGMPTLLSSWRNATLRGGAQELVAILHSGRHLAIKENQTVCVKGQAGSQYGTKVRYIVGGCTAATFCSPTLTTPCVWRGPDTDDEGYVTVASSVQVKSPPSDVAFSALGAASGGSFHVCALHPQSPRAVVTVAGSGRIATTYESTGC